MKIYTPRATKWLALLTIIGVAILIIGVLFIAVDFSNTVFQVFLTMFGGLMSFLFLSCFVAEKSRYITIDDKRIVLPKCTDKSGKMLLRKTIIHFAEIRSITSKLYKGDGIISKDTFIHTLTLKDGTMLYFTLYAYGKDAENEILKTITQRI